MARCGTARRRRARSAWRNVVALPADESSNASALRSELRMYGARARSPHSNPPVVSFSIMSRFITGDELGNIKILECGPDTDPNTSEWKFNERILDAPILGNANSSSIEVEKARKAAINRLSITDNNDSFMVCPFSKYIQPGAHGIISRKACCLPFERDMFCLHSKQRR